MFEYEITFKLSNKESKSNHQFSRYFKTTKPLLVYNDINNKIEFDFKNPTFISLCESLNYCLHSSFKKKYIAAIKRKLKGTSQGTIIVFRDEDNLLWHCHVSLKNFFE